MKKLLFIALVAFVTSAKAQYTVTSIPYNPPDTFNVGTAVTVNADDQWSPVISLPFTFTFFGNTYNSLVIGSNQITSFDLSYAGGMCPWELTSGTPIPTNTLPVNSIMWPYEDVDNTNDGEFYYQVLDTAPNRMFIASCYEAPYYGSANSVNTGICPTPPLTATSMMVLYETTNIIDIYINKKSVCTGWNNGNGIEGIQDATGANAFVVPGRNNGVQWDTTNDAWRFAPIAVGMENYHNSNGITLYPNPVAKFITVAFNNSVPANSVISISDIYGKQLMQIPLTARKTEIDVSTLSKGIYFIRMRAEKETITEKFVKE